MDTTITPIRRRMLGAAVGAVATGWLSFAGSAESRSNLLQRGEPLMSHRLPDLLRSTVHRLPGSAVDLPDEGSLAPFDRATGWLHSDRLTPEGLR
jgi:hypothetical protein